MKLSERLELNANEVAALAALIDAETRFEIAPGAGSFTTLVKAMLAYQQAWQAIQDAKEAEREAFRNS